MSVVVLTGGPFSVEIEEVQEHRPLEPAGLDFLPDIYGQVVVYTKIPGIVDVPIVGRVKSKTDAENLLNMVGEPITMTERDGTSTSGWTIRTEPAPTVRKKDGDSPDWDVNMRLWRLP